MQIGMMGLGRMGGNMVRRLLRAGSAMRFGFGGRTEQK
jgi:6-phosphogluconate dehydrogenase (decarboxylating)